MYQVEDTAVNTTDEVTALVKLHILVEEGGPNKRQRNHLKSGSNSSYE